MAMPRKTTSEKPATCQVGPLKPDDLEAVVDIDRAVAGQARRKFFEKRLAAALADPARYVYVAAREEDRLVGFALARMTSGEFGGGASGAILDAIGVEPGSRGHGVGRKLLDGVEAILAHKGVSEITTEVDWTDQVLLHFFAHEAFELAPRVVLARGTNPPLNY